MMNYALFLTNMLNRICIVLAHSNKSPPIHMSLHTYTVAWFQAYQFLFLSHNVAYLAEYLLYYNKGDHNIRIDQTKQGCTFLATSTYFLNGYIEVRQKR